MFTNGCITKAFLNRFSNVFQVPAFPDNCKATHECIPIRILSLKRFSTVSQALVKPQWMLVVSARQGWGYLAAGKFPNQNNALKRQRSGRNSEKCEVSRLTETESSQAARVMRAKDPIKITKLQMQRCLKNLKWEQFPQVKSQ